MPGDRGVEVALSASAQLGEGPTWDPATSRLLWVDILGSEVHRFDPADGSDHVRRTPQHVGAAKPRVGGGLVLNLCDGIGLYDSLDPPEPEPRWLARWPREGCRGNDAAVDPQRRLWAGTMRYDEATGGGCLYRVDPDGTVVCVLDDVTVSNGLAWSPDGVRMYYIDSPTRRVDVFDVDADDGLVTGRRPLVELTPDVAGVPDGLTVDAEGCVWVAFWDGGAVRRYTPTGRLDLVLDLPVTRPTACAFGGSDLHDLYITTGRVGLSDGDLADQPLAGSLLVLPGIGTGLPSPPFAG